MYTIYMEQYMHQFIEDNFLVLIPLWIALMVFVVFAKGTALWRSAQRKEKIWFIAILITNTLGILSIIYIVFFSKRENNKLIE